MDLYLWSNPQLNKGKTKPVKYSFSPGVTMLVGPNGSGKTSLLSQINSLFSGKGKTWTKIDSNDPIRNDYLVYLYDNVFETKHAKDIWMSNGEVSRLMQSFENSEGQDMYDYLFYKMKEIGQVSKRAATENKKGIVLLFDGLDSGLSLDVLNKIKYGVLDFIVSVEDMLEVYIICSSNSYELCSGYQCIDIVSGKNIVFGSYEEYERYFLEGSWR